jgi:hypothetical protein
LSLARKAICSDCRLEVDHVEAAIAGATEEFVANEQGGGITNLTGLPEVAATESARDAIGKVLAMSIAELDLQLS